MNYSRIWQTSPRGPQLENSQTPEPSPAESRGEARAEASQVQPSLGLQLGRGASTWVRVSPRADFAKTEMILEGSGILISLGGEMKFGL